MRSDSSTVVARGRAAWGRLRAALRVPLLAKLTGASGLVALVSLGALVWASTRPSPDRALLLVAVGVVGVTVLVDVALVYVALRPLGSLARTMRRIASGEVMARMTPSAFADDDLLTMGAAVNRVLDSLLMERVWLRQLAKETLRTAEEEQQRIARGQFGSAGAALGTLSMHARWVLDNVPAPRTKSRAVPRADAFESRATVPSLADTAVLPRYTPDDRRVR